MGWMQTNSIKALRRTQSTDFQPAKITDWPFLIHQLTTEGRNITLSLLRSLTELDARVEVETAGLKYCTVLKELWLS